jgi:hypothetical protein
LGSAGTAVNGEVGGLRKCRSSLSQWKKEKKRRKKEKEKKNKKKEEE